MRPVIQFLLAMFILLSVLVICFLISLFGFQYKDVVNTTAGGALGFLCSLIANHVIEKNENKDDKETD